MSENVKKIPYIILSLLLAIAFWLYVDDLLKNTISETYTGIPVDFIGAEDTLPNRGLMLSSGQDATVDITLSGPRQVISNLRRGDVGVQVNLSSINSVGTYPLSYDLVLPDNVDRSSITPERASRYYVTVQVSTLYSKDIPVVVDVTAPPLSEEYMYMGESMTVEPNAITLSGLVDDVDQVESCRVTLDLSGATGTVSQEFAYELLDAEGNVVDNDRIRVSDRRVMVTAPVYMIKSLPLKVDFKESPGSRLKNVNWDLEYKSITVAGDPVSLESINEIVLGEVDLSNYVDDQEIDLLIKLPADCDNLTGIDHTMLYLSFEGLETRSFTVTNITGTGLSEGQHFDKITAFVNVQLRGSAADLERVTAEDIRVVVDASEISNNGTYRDQGKVLVDGFSEVGAVGGCNIAFKITSTS